MLAASTLRNILGTKSLHEILSDRESVAILIQVKSLNKMDKINLDDFFSFLFLKNNLDEATGPW